MEITINGKPADIVIESEKTIGDIMTGIELWLQGSGNRISGLFIDEVETVVSMIPQAMERPLDGISKIDIRICTWNNLAIEAFSVLIDYCSSFANASFDERQAIIKNWEESAANAFFSTEIKDIYEIARNSFNGNGISPADTAVLAHERLGELADTAAEIKNIGKPLFEIAKRMEEFPLDMQTGRDGRAAETIKLFSGMGEKLFRLLQILKYYGLDFEIFKVDGIPVKDFLSDFGAALKELTTAYGNQDAVLAGDLAEYELAPRMTKLYTAINDYLPREV